MRPPDEEIFARDGFRCVYCGFDGRDFRGWAYLVVDHLVPHTLGGSEEAENLVTACVVCNRIKGSKTWPTLTDAKHAIAKSWAEMHRYWERNVEDRVPLRESEEEAVP